MRKKSKQARRRARRRASKRDWTCLPPKLLDLVASKLTICDFIRFRSVCATWRCSAVTYLNKLPLLILPHGEYGRTIPFFNPADCRIYEFPLPKEDRGKFALGSSYGWLVMLNEEKNNSISLLNPITRARIILPPWPGHDPINRALLCCNPTAPPKQPRQVLLALKTFSDELLMIIRHGDDYWTLIEKPQELSSYLEIAYLKEEATLYVADIDGRLAVLDLASSTLQPLTNNTPGPEIRCLPVGRRQLVATATGELLLVAWDLDVRPHPQFDVFKLDKNDKGCFKWVRAADIRGNMLFQSGGEVVEVCNQEVIGDRANQIYCLNGFSSRETRKVMVITARVEIWDIVSTVVGSRSCMDRFPPLFSYDISLRTRQRGRTSLDFSLIIPSLS